MKSRDKKSFMVSCIYILIVRSVFRPLILAIGLLIMVLFMSCNSKTQSKDKKREVIVCSQCSSEEIPSDIFYSVNEIKDQLTKKGISVKMDDKKNLCGYLLVNGIKTKEIIGALTDIELLQEVNKFFK